MVGSYKQPREVLRHYLKRFDAEAQEVKIRDHGAAIYAMMNGLQNCPYKRALLHEQRRTLDDAREIAKGYIREEEHISLQDRNSDKSNGKESRGNSRSGKKERGSATREDRNTRDVEDKKGIRIRRGCPDQAESTKNIPRSLTT